jgi:quercetin dioxygenase-like cupin family protein
MNVRPLTVTLGLVAVLAGGSWAIRRPRAQPAGVQRFELQRRDLGIPGREAVLVRTEFSPWASIAKHTHPGEEMVYVLEGELTIELAGKPPRILKPGDGFFVPANQVHAGRNAREIPTKVVSTYILEKGKPLVTLVK